MTIRELKELIKDYPDDLLVMIYSIENDSYRDIDEVYISNRANYSFINKNYNSACIID